MSPPSQRTRPPTLLTTSTSTATAASTTSMSTSSFSQDISRAILSASTHTPKAAVALPDRPTRETPLEWEFPLPPPPPPSPVETRGHGRGFWGV